MRRSTLNRNFLISFASVIILSGCGDIGDNPFGDGNVVSIYTEDGVHSCPCPSRYYYMKNSSDKKVRVTYKRTRRVITDSNHKDNGTRTRTRTLSANARYNLGCSSIGRSDSTAGQLNCGVAQSWTITNSKSAFYRIEDIEIATTKNNISNLITPPIDCRSECTSPRQAKGYCELIPGEAITSHKKKQIQEVLLKLSLNNGVTINKTELMQRFSVPNDPCLRGDLKINNGKLSNNGKYSCTLKMNHVLGVNADFDAFFSFPEKLEGEAKYNDGIIVDFSKEFNAPWIKFVDEEVNSELGGVISKIEDVRSKNMLIVSTVNSCLGFGYK